MNLQLMKRVVQSALIASTCLVTSLASARELRVIVNALGTGSDADRGSASRAARDSAEANLVCTGSLENVRSSVSSCAQVGDSYMCTATATGVCVLTTR